MAEDRFATAALRMADREATIEEVQEAANRVAADRAAPTDRNGVR